MDKLGESLAKLNDTLVKHVPKGYAQVVKEYQGRAVMSLIFTIIILVIVLGLFIFVIHLLTRIDEYADGFIATAILVAVILFVVGICLIVHIHTCLARMIAPNYQFLYDLLNNIK